MMLNIGTHSFVKVSEIETISPPESAPVKRLINKAKEDGKCIELTYGKKLKSVVVLRSGKLILSSTLPQTLIQRMMDSPEML